MPTLSSRVANFFPFVFVCAIYADETETLHDFINWPIISEKEGEVGRGDSWWVGVGGFLFTAHVFWRPWAAAHAGAIPSDVKCLTQI